MVNGEWLVDVGQGFSPAFCEAEASPYVKEIILGSNARRLHSSGYPNHLKVARGNENRHPTKKKGRKIAQDLTPVLR